MVVAAVFSLGLLDAAVLRVVLDESVSSLVGRVGSSSRILLIRSRLCLRFSSRSKRSVSISIFSISKISENTIVVIHQGRCRDRPLFRLEGKCGGGR